MRKLDKKVVRALCNRARRFLRLAKLGAPGCVLYNEVSMMLNTAETLGEGRHHADRLAERAKGQARQNKNIYGLCAFKGCDSEWDSSFDDLKYCRPCHAKLVAIREEEDREMERFEKEYPMEDEDEDEDEEGNDEDENS